ncbi:hypothetical protein BDL97_02G043200 [Sphagnum fallax]|nr:hypothetical protein BDL97_02G043200 [Sphagnum fallax]KAH8969629.1 hypothetical protein BDL97_02G043200 [Sphagnum fallax]
MMVQGCESRRVLCWQILGHSCYVWRPSRLRMAMTMPSSAAAAVGLHSLITRSSLLSSCTNDTRGAAAVAAVFDSSSPGGSFSIGSPPSSFSFFTTSCNRSLTDGELFCRNAGLVDNLSASSSHDQEEEDCSSSFQTAAAEAASFQGQKAQEEEEAVLKSVINLALPAVGAVLSDPIMSLIDTGCVGQVDSIQLAALGPNTSIFNFVFQIFSFLGAATCNLIATVGPEGPEGSTIGEQQGQQLQASQLLSYALFLAVVFGLAVVVLMELFAPQLLVLMGTRNDYLKPALTYLRIRALSAPAVLVLIVGQGACLGRQDARTPLAINSMAAAFNLAGDLIFTLWLGWGVAGAAWATLGSQCVAVLLLMRALMRISKTSRTLQESHDEPQPPPLQVGWYGLPTLEVLGPFMSLASPLIMRCALGMTVYTLAAKAAAATGTLQIAAHQVAMQVFWTLSYFPESLSIAAQSLVARNMKAKPERARDLSRMLLGFATTLGLVLMGVVAAVHYFGAFWLTADDHVRQLVRSVTLQSMLCELLCAVVVVIEGIAIASNDFAYLPHMQLLNLGGILIALGLTCKNGGGLGGIWWCLVLYFGTRLVYHSFYIGTHWNSHVLGGACVAALQLDEQQALVSS